MKEGIIRTSLRIIGTILSVLVFSSTVHSEGTIDVDFRNIILELCKNHYLFEEIIKDSLDSDHVSIWLNSKVWDNPKDTRKLVDMIIYQADKSGLNDYQVSIFGKPIVTNRIAFITVDSGSTDLDYTYSEAKSEFSWKEVAVLTVRGRSIQKGLHADSVFEVLTKFDRISESDVKNDQKNGSLIVTHHWRIDDQLIDITFERWDNMYRVSKIKNRFTYNNKKAKKKSPTNVASRPKSCHIYEDCKMYGGCKNFSNCYGACIDDCKRNNCTLCK